MTDDLRYPNARDLTTIGRTSLLTIYLDPERRALYAHEGDSLHEDAWHGCHMHVCTVPPEADGENVLAALRACDREIRALANCYVGHCWIRDWRMRVADMNRALHRALDDMRLASLLTTTRAER